MPVDNEMPEEVFAILSNAAKADEVGMASEYDTAVLTLASLYHDALRDNAAFRQREMDAENLEASVCPEDIGFVEYIGSLKSSLDRAQRERDAIAGRTYDACISIAGKVASHTDDLMRGAVRTQSSGGAGHAIGYGSAAREVVEQIEELRRAWPVLPDTTANLTSHTLPEGK